MAPPHNQRQQREDKNTAILTLHNATEFMYDKIAKATGVPKLTVRGVIKRGQAHDKSRSGRPTKITHTARKVVEGIADSNSRLPLRDITGLAYNNLIEPHGHTKVDEILGDSFKLIKPRKKPFWRRGQLRGRILLLDDGIGVWMSGEMLSLSMKAPFNKTFILLVG